MLSLLLFVLLVSAVISLSRQRDRAQAEGYQRGLRAGYHLAQRGEPLQSDPKSGLVNTPDLTDAVASRPDKPFGAVATTSSKPDSIMSFATSKAKAPSGAEDKKLSRLQTINTTLYVASLVLVGGVALFALAVEDGAFSVLTAWLIVAAYYGVGLWLHEASSNFRTVATAFIATALASMPFVGVLFDTMLGMSASSAWLLTSVICLVAYGYAAVRLRSEILGYALGAVLVSIALAMVSTLGVGVLWFLVVVLLLAISLAMMSWAMGRESRFSYVMQPLVTVGHTLPPLILLASVGLSNWLSVADLVVIWGVAGLYYAVQAGVVGYDQRQRSFNWALSRIVLSLAVLFGVYAMTVRIDLTVFMAAIIGVAHVASSTLLILERPKVPIQHDICLWFGLGLTLLAPLLFMLAPEAAVGSQRLMTTIVLTFALLASLAGAWWLRRVELGYIATAALVMLPWYLVDTVDRNTSSDFYALGYLVAAAALTASRLLLLYRAGSRARFYTAVTLGILTLIGGGFALSADSGLQAAIMIVFAVLLYMVGWRDRVMWLVVAANAYVLGGLRAILAANGFAADQIVALMSAIGALLFTIDYLGLRYWLAKYQRLQAVQAGTVVVVGVCFGLTGLLIDGGYGMVAMVGPLLAGAILTLERRRLQAGVGVALGLIVITVALQRLLALIVDPISLHVLVYTHWWVVVFAGLAFVEWRADSFRRATVYAYTALAILSAFGIEYALSENIMFRVLFLLEHAVLLIAGLAVSWRVLTWWGAAGITLAILYMFRGFTSLFLTLIGLIIILAVIWVVRRDSQKPNL